MTSPTSSPRPSAGKRAHCDEPWVGLFSIRTNLAVVFCPCYLQMKLGNLEEASVEQLWNAPRLVRMRREFAAGRLPRHCRGQLCPPALAVGSPPRPGLRVAFVSLARRLVAALRSGGRRARRVGRRFA